MLQHFQQLGQRRQHILDSVRDLMSDRIDQRPVGPRNHAQDDQLFGPLNQAIIYAVAQDDHQLAIKLFRESYALALAYEQANGCEIHKGAPAFNVGLACLRSYDFTGAMHYFELAQEETQFTTGTSTWNIFLNPLFQSNYWDAVDAGANAFPVPLYQEFWGQALSGTTAKANWRRVSGQSKLLYITTMARRMRYRQLLAQSGWDGSASAAIAYWNLNADLSRLLETEVYRRADITAPKPWKLYNLLTQGFAATRAGNVSAWVTNLYTTRKINNTKTFNKHFPAVRDDILDQALPRDERIGNAVYLLYATRNQVQHHIDERMILYRDPDAARFTADVLLTLCRLDSWTI